mmetsp:Transcript_13193/g.34578  ORF Transcript_13193/g.34578 Transcript_13193/m.34578 type:complete len:201 (-) Transcript_13193:802-1404(-)
MHRQLRTRQPKRQPKRRSMNTPTWPPRKRRSRLSSCAALRSTTINTCRMASNWFRRARRRRSGRRCGGRWRGETNGLGVPSCKRQEACGQRGAGRGRRRSWGRRIRCERRRRRWRKRRRTRCGRTSRLRCSGPRWTPSAGRAGSAGATRSCTRCTTVACQCSAMARRPSASKAGESHAPLRCLLLRRRRVHGGQNRRLQR